MVDKCLGRGVKVYALDIVTRARALRSAMGCVLKRAAERVYGLLDHTANMNMLRLLVSWLGHNRRISSL